MSAEALKTAFEKAFSAFILNHASLPNDMDEAVRYSALGVGHRWRPILALTAAQAYSTPLAQALPAAFAAEMTHVASCIIDDILDQSGIRHGKPSCHARFGIGTTVLAQIKLVNLCHQCLQDLPAGMEAVGMRLHREYCALTNTMLYSEEQDIVTASQKLEFDQLLKNATTKSGHLMGFAVAAGAIVGAAPMREIELIRDFGIQLGTAYQVKDDLNDLVGNPKVLGKPIGQDANKTSTLPSLLGPDGCRDLIHKLKSQAVESIEGLSYLGGLVSLVDLIVPE